MELWRQETEIEDGMGGGRRLVEQGSGGRKTECVSVLYLVGSFEVLYRICWTVYLVLRLLRSAWAWYMN